MTQEQLERKQALRARMSLERQAITSAEQRQHATRICQHLDAYMKEHAGLVAGRTVMTYMPFRSEADVLPFTEQLWADGVAVAMPRVEKTTKQLMVHLIRGCDELEIGAWGIMEPKLSTPLVDSVASIAAVLVPGLAFDTRGGRLGYGAGFYDRFFDQFVRQQLPMPLRIGVCYGAQLVEAVPMDTHDYPMDAVVTEAGVLSGW